MTSFSACCCDRMAGMERCCVGEAGECAWAGGGACRIEWGVGMGLVVETAEAEEEPGRCGVLPLVFETLRVC